LRWVGKEAVNAALNLAFEKINYHRIEAHINLNNIASIKLAESVGMVYECTRKVLYMRMRNGQINSSIIKTEINTTT
jgi:RimJ/RimL family protein N-acetyltransferase